MKSLLASARASGGLDRVDHAVQLLEDEWRRHGDVRLERLWTEQKRLLAGDPSGSLTLLTELIKADLRCRFARGQSPTVAGYLAEYPELSSADSRVLSLIYEEFCLAEERGDSVDVSSFCERYPRWKDSLISQLQYHHLFSRAIAESPSSPTFPEPGDCFEEFELVSLLGKGGTSRVFLARDLSLGGKQVVLKVSLDKGREPQAQGPLEHPNIVPVNSVVFDDREMRGLSMPYWPGLPLDEVIRRVDPASRPRGAMALWDALTGTAESPDAHPPDAGRRPGPSLDAAGPRGDGWAGFPIRGTYSDGVAWVVKKLAEALDYAHGRRTYHRDVKPGNVLLTFHHGPQLLDFNLAESPHSASQAQAAIHGGTVPYMAPEQIEAFLDPQLWHKVGAKADLYSLGLVLRELLTGQAPDVPAVTLAPRRALQLLLERRPKVDVSVRRANPAIPHAMEAILGKCLTMAPEDRYADARALADDLDRFLQRRPLVHAVNRSRRERCGNWIHRNRRMVSVAMVCLLPIAVVHEFAPRRPAVNREPIESSRPFLAAVELVDGDRSDGRVVRTLEQFVADYPDSALPGIYSCFAADREGYDRTADTRFREAMKTPDAFREVIAWGKAHERLPIQLESFAAVRIKRGDDRDDELSELDEEERRPAVIDYYRLALDALRLADALRPESDSSAYKPIAYDLTRMEEFFGDYGAASDRATRAIVGIASVKDREDSELDPIKKQVLLLKWLSLRCRINSKRLTRLRTDASPSGAVEADHCKNEILRDLRVYLGKLSTIQVRAKDEWRAEEIHALATLTLGEFELDAGSLDDAEAHLKESQKTLPKYAELFQEVHGGNRRAPYLKPYEERLKNAMKRLAEQKAGQAAAGPGR